MKSAFYRWDGFSYYMRFKDFLPDLSLSFILWVIIGGVFACIFWIVIHCFLKLCPRSFGKISFEHIITWLGFTVVAMILVSFVSRTLFNVGITKLIKVDNYYSIIGMFSVLTLPLLRLVNKYIRIEKLFNIFLEHLTPLVWFFAILFIISFPLSMYKGKEPVNNKLPQNYQSTADSRQERPNIILVIMDTLTARDMRVYGYKRPTTPFISEWAENAILFDRAYASSNWTTPTTMTIMTGQRPWTHRIWYRAENKPVSRYENNIANVLSNHGYDLYSYVQNNHAHPATLGIKDFFLKKDSAETFWIPNEWWVGKLTDFFVNRRIAAEWIISDNPILKPLNLKYFRWPVFSSSILAETVYDRFFEDMLHKQNKPIFAWIHLYPPHDLFLPPDPYMGLFGDEDRFDTAKKQLDSKLMYKYYKSDEQEDIDILRKRYDEFILYSDQQFKLFLSRLHETIDMSNTVIILTSDHGEIFSHGYSNHDGPYLYEPLVHVPLIIKMPAGLKEGTNQGIGKRIEVNIDQADIAPTILEIAGIPPPEWIEGQSIMPLIYDKPAETRPIFSMQLIKNNVMITDKITRGTIAVWEGDYKLIHYLEEDKSLLFNIRKDPDELSDLYTKEPEISNNLISTIKENLKMANERNKKLN